MCQRRVKTELGRTGWYCCHHGIGMYPWIRSHIWVVFIINSYELGQQCKGSWQFHETLSVIWSPVNGWLLFNVNEKYSRMNFSIAPIHKGILIILEIYYRHLGICFSSQRVSESQCNQIRNHNRAWRKEETSSCCQVVLFESQPKLPSDVRSWLQKSQGKVNMVLMLTAYR